MEEGPIAQATGNNNNIIEVYAQRMEVHRGWQNHQTETLTLKDISSISIKGWINCTLIVETNKGRVYHFEHVSLPEARGIKTVVYSQKQKASTYN